MLARLFTCSAKSAALDKGQANPALSSLARLFGFEASKHRVRTEIVAGLTTFLMMAYILAVNPSIFSALGEEMPAGAVFTATALAAVVGTLVMAFWAKRPFVLAPGMGLNAFFVYTVCLSMGYSWRFALTAVFLEGIIFIILTLTNVREAIVNCIPQSLKSAIGAGIGLFIAFIGLKNAGIIVANDATFVSLGSLTAPASIVAIFGFVLMSALVIMKVPGGLLLGVIITTLVGIPLGVTELQGVVSMPHSVAPIFAQFEWSEVLSIDMVIVVFTFMFIDMFDTIGTVIGVCGKAGMIEADGRIPRLKEIFMADAIATTVGALLGTSTTTTYVESASGVAQGGRTGLTAFTAALCFAAALFFSPLFLSIPGAATGPVLVIVGAFMLESVGKIEFTDYSECIPSTICLLAMPLAYSISDGIMLGVISYVLINLACGKVKKLNPALCILAALFVAKYAFF